MDPRSSLKKTKSSRKESSFPAELPLIKSVGAAIRQSPATPRKFVTLYHRNNKIRMRSDEHDKRELRSRQTMAEEQNDTLYL